VLDHVDFAVTDLARSRDFYAKVLAPLGISPLLDISHADGRSGTGFGVAGVPRLWIGGGQPVGGRLHIAFRADSRDAVVAFHVAALRAGGADHGGPGLRPEYGDSYYAAYARDPDGHVIEAVCRRRV